MPGTIKVSVLDFMGLHSSSILIRVSMGKREYQSWDKGDFSFPLATLREKLIITLEDADGNEISHTGVDTMSVVEKGLWDDFFPLEGGGHVHMKLQFILSEEERNRIRIMRESALKKKHDELLNRSPRSLETDSSVALSLYLNPEISAASVGEVDPQAGPVENPVNFGEDPQSVIGITERTYIDHKQTTPNDTDRSEETTSTTSVLQEVEVKLSEVNSGGLVEKIETQSPPADFTARPINAEAASSPLLCAEPAIAAKTNSISSKLEEDRTHNTEKQSPPDKTPSNVRKMISAFESSLSQDMKPHIKPPLTKSQSSKIEMEDPLKNPRLQEVVMENTKQAQSILGRVVNPILTGELQQAPSYIRKKKALIGFDRASEGTTSSQDTGQLKELSEIPIQSKGTNSSLENKIKLDSKEKRKSLEDFMRMSTVETVTVSGQIFNEHSGRHQPCNLFMDQRNSGGTSAIKGSEWEINSKDSNVSNIQRTSNDKLRSVAYSEGMRHSFESSGTWIFPDEKRPLCVTTGGKQVMDLMGDGRVETKTHQERMSFSIVEHAEECSLHGGTDLEVNKVEKTSHKFRKSSLESSEDVENSRGPFGQAIKVAIMVGFGTLVLLTRQRKNR